ncbi:unnamed protein product [Ceutorhynchus assimilis]|uniref:Cyclin N-terminal domain-containing protein n=1 Tax=Ceutorhynchus assimilis TaxID=467358 RepID=A0A9N9Q7Z5_9CUCU|nr:unnamed protein product [Ceutorhynchus assimilis]
MDKRRGRPFPDAVILKPLAFNLEEALQVENLYRPNLYAMYQNDVRNGEVTLSSRDDAVNRLRFLRVWLDIPHFTFFLSVSYLDMFLSKMRVQEKYLKCITLSCLHLALTNSCDQVDVNHLVKISQSKCTSGDVIRMSKIIKEKLKSPPVKTAVDFLEIYIEVLKYISTQWEHIIKKDLNSIKQRMLILLEVLLANSNTAYLRPAAIALIVFQREVEKIMAVGLPNKSVYFLGEVLQFLATVREIQLKCKIKNSELRACFLQVSKVLQEYEKRGSKGDRHREQLNWNFSMSTVQESQNRSSYCPSFQTIQE